MRFFVESANNSDQCRWASLSSLVAVVVTLIGQRSRITPPAKINTEASMTIKQVRLESEYPQAIAAITAMQKAHCTVTRALLTSAPLCR